MSRFMGVFCISPAALAKCKICVVCRFFCVGAGGGGVAYQHYHDLVVMRALAQLSWTLFLGSSCCKSVAVQA